MQENRGAGDTSAEWRRKKRGKRKKERKKRGKKGEFIWRTYDRDKRDEPFVYTL